MPERQSLRSLAILLALSAPCTAIAFSSQPVDGVVQVPMKKVTHNDIGNLHMPNLNIEKRSSGAPDFIDALSNQRFYYLTEAEVGTPPQKLDLLIDTGSSDTWVFTPQSQAHGRVKTTTFDPNQSTSFKSNSTDFKIKYGKGQASGSWGTDKFKIGGAALQHLSIGLAKTVSQVTTGLVGIGRPQAEITFNTDGSEYLNLPLEMQAEGLINSAAYSLSLNDVNDKEGSLLFGGVDHNQYTGPLVTLPIVHPKHMGVMLQGIKGDGRAKYQLLDKPNIAVLDSGTSLTYLDDSTLGALRTALNSNPSFAIGERYYTDCNITDHLWFDFGNINIPVPSYEFLWPIDMFVDGVTASVAFPQNSCYVGFEQSGNDENFMLLGDNVLRSMYLVYDITDSRIGVARKKAGTGKPNIEAIVPGKPLPGSS